MITHKIRMAALVLAAGLSGPAQAALHDRGSGLVYDDVLNVTWLQDANYGAGSIYDDIGINGGTAIDGRMTWQNAMNWTANLSYYDSVRKVTYDDWRLPSINPVNGTSYNYSGSAYDGSVDFGYNITNPNSELAYMFYVNLGNSGYFTTTGSVSGCFIDSSNTCLKNTGPFVNLQPFVYWSSNDDYASDASVVADFRMDEGYQSLISKDNSVCAWAVRNGDVGIAAVPEASTWVMLLVGLGLVGAAARRQRR